jgi:hypothetical protein
VHVDRLRGAGFQERVDRVDLINGVVAGH